MVCIFFLVFTVSTAISQISEPTINWYSESTSNGISIQNSPPKGGRYPKDVDDLYNCSYLVFFTRITNEGESPINLSLELSASNFFIPQSPNTFVALSLPSDKMTLEKVNEFTYGLSNFDPLAKSSEHLETLKPYEDFLFYVVAFFYQTEDGEWSEERGGNRAQLTLKGQELFYDMPPQINSLPIGEIILNE
ncbi:MAG: hypothetical protein AAGA64_12335 [Bacteroidota bacterium]